MQTRLFALGVGVIYLLVGIVGFIPALYTAPTVNAPHLDVTLSYGNLLGLFPVNALHDVVHILVGIAGIATAARLTPARLYASTLFIVYGLLCIFGFIPQLNTLFGLVPLFGNDVWLHAATAIVASYFGFVAPASSAVEPAPLAAH